MLFNSLPFLLFFLPVALVGFYSAAALSHRWAAAWLVAVSFLFYIWSSAPLAFLLGGSIAFNFLCGVLILRAQARENLQSMYLTIGICGDLLLLFYYKYFFGLLNWLGFHGLIQLSHPYSMALPLGISFFTFTQIGYLVDCKGGVVTTNRLLDYGLFVSFFPHLIAGPILHHREMMPQFADPKTYQFRWKNLAVGTVLFLIGLTKKMIIADHFSLQVSQVFDQTPDLVLFDAWNGALRYSLQLYFDFSGYSDMAIGLALMFGMRFPANFNSPYRAANIIDFWQRWHMTLTRYLTLYLYNPVALWVSRHRIARGQSVSRKAISTAGGFLSMIALPTFYTMTLAGVWHGAGLQFLIFGLLHASYLTINHAWRSFGPRVPEIPPHPVLRLTATVGKIALTYLAVVVAEVFFRASSVHAAFHVLKGMVGFGGIYPHVLLTPGAQDSLSLAQATSDLIWTSLRKISFLFIVFLVVWFMPNSLQILSDYEPSLSKIRLDSLITFTWRPDLAWALVLGLVASIELLRLTGMTEFLYFRF